MARVIAPNKEYAGVSAGVSFHGGEGNTDDPYILAWFRDHGYEVEEKNRALEADQSPVLGGEMSVAPAQKKRRKKEA